MASFYIPLTGLESDSTALNTIANDLANLNTTGFKDQTVNFSDLFYQQLGDEGSGNLIQEGSGVGVASIESQYTQGSIVSTGNSTDVAINGNGFFVLSGGRRRGQHQCSAGWDQYSCWTGGATASNFNLWHDGQSRR
jgi:flagellar hook protein FlgE